MTADEKAEIAGLIRERQRLICDRSGDPEVFDKLYDATQALRSALSRFRGVRHEGKLYLSYAGELLVLDLATVEDAS